MAEQWKYRIIKVNLAVPNASQPVVVFDSLLGSNAAPQTPGTPKSPKLIYYLNSPSSYGGLQSFTDNWEACGVIPSGSMAFILLKHHK